MTPWRDKQQQQEKESIRTLNDIEMAEIEAEDYRTQRLTYMEDDYSF
ncbi:MAG TPA: hypothetical protein VK250_02975 [Nitrososphaeraceae archaeon]|nr:hypothetical protein [Nitrososphaeraceae archaeon]